MAYVMKKPNGAPQQREDRWAPASVTGTPMGAPAMPAQTSAPQKAPGAASGRFVNFSRYLNANKDIAQREGQKVADQVERNASGAAAAATQAKQNADIRANPLPPQAYELEPTAPRPVDTGVTAADAAKKAGTAQQQMKIGTQSGAGRQALFGTSRLNSALMGAQVGGQLQQTATRYGGLSKMVADARAAETASDATLASRKAASDAQATQATADQAGQAEAQAQKEAEAREATADEDSLWFDLWQQGALRNVYWGDDLAQQLRWRAELDKKYGTGTYDKVRAAVIRRQQSGRPY